MDGVQNRGNRERRGMRENRERHAVHSSYIWLGGLQGAAAVFAALLVGVLLQIIPELFNPDSLGQFVNGGLAAIIIVLLFLGTVIVSLAASLIYRLVSYKHIWYEFGDEEFSFYSGVFNKKRVHVPYRRIQSVDQTASLLQRVFGVCTVQIDTAGGASNKAVSVPFLRKADAEALRADLFARKSAAVGAPFREADAPSSFGNVLDAPAEVWDDVRGVFAGSEVDTGRISFQYGITNSELILTGLSNNTTLVLVVVGIIGVFSQVADFVSQMAGEAGGAVAEVLADAGLALFGNSLIALIVVGLIALSLFVWVMSALGTCISFGGFKARRRGDRIEVERGLLQHRFHGVSVDRVQSVVVKQTFVRRIFGFCELSLGKVDASSGSGGMDDSLSEGALVVHPFVKVDRVPEIVAGLVPEFADMPTERRRVPKVALRRALVRRTIIQGWGLWCAVALALLHVGVMLGVSAYGDGFMSAGELFWFDRIALVGYVACAVAEVLAAVGAVLWARSSWFSFNRRFMQVKNGGLGTVSVCLPREKIQFGFSKSNPLQRRAKVATITARTAAGLQGTSTRLIDACEEDAAAWLAWLVPGGNVIE